MLAWPVRLARSKNLRRSRQQGAQSQKGLCWCGREGPTVFLRRAGTFVLWDSDAVRRRAGVLSSDVCWGFGLFGGGYSGDILSTVDAYSTSLVHSTPTALSEVRYDLAATTVGNYGLFGGGHTTDGGTSFDMFSATVDAYNTSLVRNTPTELSGSRAVLAATTVGNYGLFGGGYIIIKNMAYLSFAIVDAYSASLVRSTPTSLSEKSTVWQRRL